MHSEKTGPHRTLGVLLPTRNSAALLPAHLQSMAAWVDLAEEVVVVDSDSADDTLKLIDHKLNHPRLRLLNHPPGLYESWNHGIAHLTTDYTYVSTVGDPITRDGLLHLIDLCVRFGSDLAVSEPDFVDESGRPVAPRNWPVRRLIECLRLKEPICLEGAILFLFATAFIPDSLLGTSAGNLYRTRLLKTHPFSCEFGLGCDTAWAIQQALKLRMVVTPRRINQFRLHRKQYAAEEYHVEDAEGKLWQLAEASLRAGLRQNPQCSVEAEALGLREQVALALSQCEWKAKLERERRRPWPWIFNPLAWQARLMRGRSERELQRRLAQAVEQIESSYRLMS